MYILLIALGIIGIVFAGVNFIVGNDNKEKYHYRRKNRMMTASEEKCFRVLTKFFGDEYYIVPQVHLSAILEHRIKGQNFKGAFSHINGKSVDFVLMDRQTLKMVCAVELDDSTHDRDERKLRDAEVERIFREAGMPLIRLRKIGKMSVKELLGRFEGVI